jgi:hypothetical protein
MDTKETMTKALNNLKTQIKSEIRDAINNCVHFSDAEYDELFIKMEKYFKYKEKVDRLV